MHSFKKEIASFLLKYRGRRIEDNGFSDFYETVDTVLLGSGQIWVDELGFEVVDDSVPITEQSTTEDLSDEPVNLNFEDTTATT